MLLKITDIHTYNFSPEHIAEYNSISLWTCGPLNGRQGMMTSLTAAGAFFVSFASCSDQLGDRIPKPTRDVALVTRRVADPAARSRDPPRNGIAAEPLKFFFNQNVR
jgi:hypothetical protein